MGIVDNALMGASGQGGYFLTRSLRFRKSASAYLNRTMTTATDAKKWTWSAWIKRGLFGASAQAGLIASGNATTDGSGVTFIYGTGEFFNFYDYISSSFTTNLITTQVFRDPSAWYHLVVAVDTTQATASNRVKMYVNGTQITSFSTAVYPALNSTGYMNSGTYATTIGREGGFGNYYDGYMTEMNFIDGQQLTPSSFGSTNTLTGVWQPARYAGTYGTNGFYLPFTDNSALTTSSNVGLGKDFSGNGNYWTTNNISITAGATYDSMTDVPTLTSATAANFCTWNPLSKSTDHSTSNGNLSATSSAAGSLCATIGASSGKWYWEFNYTNRTATNSPVIGFGNELFNYTNPPFTYLGSDLNAGGINVINGNASINGTSTAYGSAIATNDVVMFAMDVPNRKFYIGKNGTWFNSGDPVAGTNSWPYSATILGSTFFPAVNLYTDTIAANFGQRPFAYTPPTGFVALNTFNLPTSTILKGNTVMDATLWTGDGTAKTIVNAAPFKPDLVWIKQRSGTASYVLTDSVRGAGYTLQSNGTDAEIYFTTVLTSFNSNGFSVGASGNTGANGSTYVGWQWQAGQGSSSSNTNGTITSTVSVNASAGFSVVTYTGTGANATIGHGLGVAPSMVVIKSRTSGSTGWVVYFKNVNSAPQTSYLYLNSTNAVGTGYAGYWNSTNPTSSVFSIGTDADVSANGGNMVAYCWTPIAGFSAFGSYTGNGSADGPFVYTGFRPKWVMIKRSDSGNNWIVVDTARNTYNLATAQLSPNSSAAEVTGPDFNPDIISNGFKLRTTLDASNGSGGTYIYAAFAENPFKNALAR